MCLLEEGKAVFSRKLGVVELSDNLDIIPEGETVLITLNLQSLIMGLASWSVE